MTETERKALALLLTMQASLIAKAFGTVDDEWMREGRKHVLRQTNMAHELVNKLMETRQ